MGPARAAQWRAGAAAIVGVAVLVALGLSRGATGATAASTQASPTCPSGTTVVSAVELHPGERVRVSSGYVFAFCAPAGQLPPGATDVEVRLVVDGTHYVLGRADAAADGWLETLVTIPPIVPAGAGEIEVAGAAPAAVVLASEP